MRKKQRDASGLFVAEGEKSVRDLQSCFETVHLFSTNPEQREATVISEAEMKKITHLSTPSSLLCVFRQQVHRWQHADVEQGLSLALDGIQDPGNVGTIIRTAAWFGIEYVFCSPSCADVYNSKTVKATMGALSSVKVIYADLCALLKVCQCVTFGTFMTGEDLYQAALPKRGIVVMGSEGKGISGEVERCINTRLSIPSFADKGTESLNVAVAAGIVCSEFRRR